MFLTGSWFWRGFQSAIFYYISCAPCTKLAYRRRRRKEFKRAKAEKAAHSEAEQGLYEHPSPFSTNPYWKEEISLGPGPPQGRGDKEGKGKPGSGRQLRSGGVGSSTDTGTNSADTILGEEGIEQTRYSGEGWNRKRYQREDEILWGLENQDARRSSNSRFASWDYSRVRNPAVNDLHPPVVSTRPTHRGETQWMLQPPPKAKIMEGKQKTDTPRRSRSGSGGSNGSRGSRKKGPDVSLSRKMGERLMESKFKQGGMPSVGELSIEMSRDPSNRSTTSSKSKVRGQPNDRDTLTFSRPSSESLTRKTPPPPISISSDLSLPSPPLPRPPLTTIPSASLPQKQRERPRHLRPLLLSTNSDASLRILQELVSPASQLNTIKTTSAPLPDAAVSVSLPPVTDNEHQELKLPEVESWFPESSWNFSAGRKHEPRYRWSMEI
ncbi:hypothetical protein MMC28_005082 [Mycoblastus sanguinarius]|nr:hypothetical protein [Mycoblastus sanguinarius]